jgi:hypothetical protein
LNCSHRYRRRATSESRSIIEASFRALAAAFHKSGTISSRGASGGSDAVLGSEHKQQRLFSRGGPQL